MKKHCIIFFLFTVFCVPISFANENSSLPPEEIQLVYKFLKKLKDNTPFTFEEELYFFGTANEDVYIQAEYMNSEGKWIAEKPKYSLLGELIRKKKAIFLLDVQNKYDISTTRISSSSPEFTASVEKFALEEIKNIFCEYKYVFFLQIAKPTGQPDTRIKNIIFSVYKNTKSKNSNEHKYHILLPSTIIDNVYAPFALGFRFKDDYEFDDPKFCHVQYIYSRLELHKLINHINVMEAAFKRGTLQVPKEGE